MRTRKYDVVCVWASVQIFEGLDKSILDNWGCLVSTIPDQQLIVADKPVRWLLQDLCSCVFLVVISSLASQTNPTCSHCWLPHSTRRNGGVWFYSTKTHPTVSSCQVHTNQYNEQGKLAWLAINPVQAVLHAWVKDHPLHRGILHNKKSNEPGQTTVCTTWLCLHAAPPKTPACNNTHPRLRHTFRLTSHSQTHYQSLHHSPQQSYDDSDR